MPKLMISLDKKILDADTAVAERMVEYGKNEKLYILIPCDKKIKVELSETVMVYGTGGSKIKQFFGLIRLGNNLIKDDDKKISEITTQDPFFTGLAGYLLKKANPSIVLELQLHGDFFSGVYYKKQNLLKYYLAKFLVKKADRIRVVGRRIENSLLDLGVSADAIVLRPIGIDKQIIERQEVQIDLKQKYSGYSKVYLSLCRLEEVKNLSWLLDVFAEAVKKKPDILLLIVGEGSEKSNLEHKIKRLNLTENVIIEPWTIDPISFLKSCDCFLFPSISEGYGLAAMEAEASGCKIITNDVGVANYELKPGPQVEIINIDDKDNWVKAMLNI